VPQRFEVTLPAALAAEPPVDVALILGSGLGALADRVEATRISQYRHLDGFPQTATRVPGHAERLVIGALGGVRVAVFQGRLHCYQGFSARETSYPVRLASALGAHTLIATNASGAVGAEIAPGSIVVLSDHANFAGDNPLTAWPGPAGGSPFVPMREAYDEELRDIALGAAQASGIVVRDGGTYAWVRGPSFETPAEVRALATLGADVVGMSTVPEVIAARALGMRVLALSLVTNLAAGPTLSHDEVLAAGRVAEARLGTLLLAILQRLA
jgi:purine-nucleoside phosphorylase